MGARRRHASTPEKHPALTDYPARERAERDALDGSFSVRRPAPRPVLFRRREQFDRITILSDEPRAGRDRERRASGIDVPASAAAHRRWRRTDQRADAAAAAAEPGDDSVPWYGPAAAAAADRIYETATQPAGGGSATRRAATAAAAPRCDPYRPVRDRPPNGPGDLADRADRAGFRLSALGSCGLRAVFT